MSQQPFMRLGIEALFLRPGEVGGSEVYLRHLLHALGQIDERNAYTIFVGEHNQGTFDPLPPNFKEQVIPVSHANGLGGRLRHSLEAQGWLPSRIGRAMEESRVDLVHFPGTTIDPLSLGLPSVLTIHDIQQAYLPHFFSLRERLRRRRFYGPSARKAKHVIAISEFTRQSLLDRYRLPAEHVSTVYFGVSQLYFEPVAEEECCRVREKYQLPEHYVFYPAQLWPHKNHRTLVRAVGLLRRRYQQPVSLVLCGFPTLDAAHLWPEEAADAAVQVIGRAPEEDLPALYRMSQMLVFPSLFEGFGLPILEAMASGCPVVCADIPPLLEIGDDAVLTIDPHDPESIAAAMARLLSEPALQAELVRKGIAQARKFTWEQCARQTLDIYRQVAGKEPAG